MSDTHLRFKPAEGRQVRRPDGEILAAEGELVAPDSYWHRRLADGDVVLVDDEDAPAKKGK